MSVDDQLLKPDGTIITFVDIMALKFARRIALLLTRDIDESFTPSLRRLLFLSFMFWLISIVFAVNLLDLFISSLFAFSTALYSKNSKCSGEGTNIQTGIKKINLASVAVFLFLIGISILKPMEIFYAIAFMLYVIALNYVKRLGGSPPKKKKVKSLVPALNQDQSL